MEDLPLMDLPLTDIPSKMDSEERKESVQPDTNIDNQKIDPKKICATIVNSLIDTLNLKKRKRQEEDFVLKNSGITITKVQDTTEKILHLLHCRPPDRNLLFF
jgi:hypothetical protein